LQVDGNDNCFFDHGDGTAGWAAGTSLETAGDLSFNAAYTQNTVWQETADAVLAVGVWTRVAVTWDGSLPFASVRFYANDVEVADTDLTDTAQGTRPDDSDVEVVIGCNANHSFDGAISDVRLYDRALTAAEVAAL